MDPFVIVYEKTADIRHVVKEPSSIINVNYEYSNGYICPLKGSRSERGRGYSGLMGTTKDKICCLLGAHFIKNR